MSRPIPLRPDPLAIRSAASRSFARAFVACAFAAIEGRRPDDAIEIAPKIWPADRDVATLVKAAVSPTTTDSASVLVQTILTDFLAGLAPQSAAAELIARGLQLRFDGRGAISAPSIIAPAAKFVGEGQPIPVAQGQTGGPLPNSRSSSSFRTSCFLARRTMWRPVSARRCVRRAEDRSTQRCSQPMPACLIYAHLA